MDITRSDRLTCIRCATEKDLERIVQVDRLSFARQWDYHDFKAALSDLFLVFEKREILGFLIGCHWETEKKAILMRLAVHPEHRRKGIGTMLMESALEALAKMGILDVETNVEIGHPEVMRLCEKAGFRVTKVVPVNQEENDEVYVMKLRLNTQSHAA